MLPVLVRWIPTVGAAQSGRSHRARPICEDAFVPLRQRPWVALRASARTDTLARGLKNPSASAGADRCGPDALLLRDQTACSAQYGGLARVTLRQTVAIE